MKNEISVIGICYMMFMLCACIEWGTSGDPSAILFVGVVGLVLSSIMGLNMMIETETDYIEGDI